MKTHTHKNGNLTLVDELPVVLLVIDQCRKGEKFSVLSSTKIHKHIIEQWLGMRTQQLCYGEITLHTHTHTQHRSLYYKLALQKSLSTIPE